MEVRKQHTVKDVSKYADKTEHTIRRHISEGILKSVKVGGSRRVNHDELVRYLGMDPLDSHDAK